MRRTGLVLFVLVTCLMLAGCFKVKNTDGLRAAYEKIELAYPLVVEIDARQDLKAKDRQALIDSYNAAKASVNSFLKDVKTKSVDVVDVPKEAFEKDTIIKAMTMHRNNVTKVAEELSISRPTLYDLMKKYNITTS